MVHNPGAVYDKAGTDRDKAETLFTKALAIAELTLGPEHADTVNYVIKLGDLYGHAGNYGRALEHYLRAQARPAPAPAQDSQPKPQFAPC